MKQVYTFSLNDVAQYVQPNNRYYGLNFMLINTFLYLLECFQQLDLLFLNETGGVGTSPKFDSNVY